MPYTPKSSRTDFKGGINILASEHFQFIEAGATLDAMAIGETYLPVGTPVARNTTTGKFEVYSETTAGTLEPGFDEFSILNIDVNVDGQNDLIVGEVLVRGSVYEAKLPAGFTDAFKAATRPQIRYVRHI
ncbi:hypothetical protein [Halobacillus naozhouensis]|uniref:Head decoration protein n=1 Tax=Halobacillus naozhouensis TaxID=554880 RepID=A0ABY8J5R6_9BACI|nr:hypothetical protein [Halobacillus naozhouensis]WFT76236.1 hypothetical protein P9989_07700 [Halobacillus naozhouensis]